MPFAQLPVSTPRPVRARSSEEPSRVPATRAQFLFGSLDLVCELVSVLVTWRARRRCRLGEISLYLGYPVVPPRCSTPLHPDAATQWLVVITGYLWPLNEKRAPPTALVTA